MLRSRLLHAVIAVAASGALAAVLLVGAVRWLTPARLDGPVADGTPNGRQRAWFTPRGFHRPEADDRPSRSFSWTSAQANIRVPNIDCSRPYRVSFRMAAGRGPDTAPPPHLIVSVDGVPRLRADTSNEPREYTVEAPAAGSSTLVVGLNLSNTFVPGPHDCRELGVVVDNVAIEAIDGPWRPTREVALLFALAVMGMTAAALACGFPPAQAVAAGVASAAAGAWLLALDAAFLGTYVTRVLHISTGAAILAAGVALTRRRWPSPAHAPEWGVAVGITIAAAALKMAFFGHPSAALGDSIFQVHRAQYVEGGRYFFTSITPRPFFEFPYAIALYVAAMPLWDWFPGELDRVRLLRGLSIAADALVGVAMYFALRRAWHSRAMALSFAGLWPFARVPLATLCSSNLTNLFGQGLFGAGMAMVAWMAAAGRANAWGVAGVAGLLTAAFLSHFSTISIGVPLGILVGLLLLAAPEGDRRLGAWVLAAVLTAAGVSYVVYYSQFHPVYRATLDWVLAGEDAGEERLMAAPAAVKAVRWQAQAREAIGTFTLAGALAGTVWLLRRRRQPAALVLAGWGLAWVMFAILGVLTPVEMRANLAGAPVLLALTCGALAAAAQASRLGAVLAWGAGIAIAWSGFTLWVHCLIG